MSCPRTAWFVSETSRKLCEVLVLTDSLSRRQLDVFSVAINVSGRLIVIDTANENSFEKYNNKMPYSQYNKFMRV